MKIITAESISLHHALVTVEGVLHQAYNVVYEDDTQAVEYRPIKEDNSVNVFKHEDFIKSEADLEKPYSDTANDDMGYPDKPKAS